MLKDLAVKTENMCTNGGIIGHGNYEKEINENA